MTRFKISKTKLGRWPLAGLVLALLSVGTSAQATFSWTQVPNDGTHYTQSGPALTEVYSDPCSPNGGLEQIHMFAIKDDGYLWEDIGNPGSSMPEYEGPWSWAGWQNNIDADTSCNNGPCQFSGSNPSATAFTLVTSLGQYWSDQIAVVARNTTTDVAYINLFIGDPDECEDRDWLGWSPIPGTWVNDVAVTFWYPYIYVFGEGSNGMMFMTRINGSAFGPNWTTPVAIPNGWFNAGAAAVVVDSNIFVVGRSTDNNYYWSSSTDGASFSSWVELPPYGFQSAPAISGWSGGHLDVSGIATFSALFHATTDNYGQTWTSFSQVDSSETRYPPASFSFYGNWGVTRMAQTEGYYPQYGTVWEGDGP